MGRSTALRTALKLSLIPYAESRGFKVDKSAQPQFTTFRRQVGDRVHVFDVQWDKSGEARFVLNFGEAPATSVVRQGVPVEAEKIEVYDCRPMLRLQRKLGGSMRCWFQLRKPFLQQLVTLSRDHTPEEVVQSVVAAFPEVEAWWSFGARGPHVHGLR